MADNLAVTPGSGKTILADEVTDGTLSTGVVAFGKIMDGTLDSTNKLVVTAGGAAKVDGSATTQPVSAASLPLPTGAATSANQTTANSSLGNIDTSTATVATKTTAIDTNAGATTDAAATAGSTGTVSAKLRRISADIDSIKTNTAAATPAGTNLIGKVGIDQTTPGTTNAVVPTGLTASGSSLTANPVTIGGRGSTAMPTAVSDGQVVNALMSKTGKVITRNVLRENLVNQQTTITSSTSETTIVTADATYKLDLYGLVLTNTSGTGTKVTIKDSTAGTTRFVLWVPANDTRGFMLTPDAGHKQAAANNNWTATCGTSVASLEVTAMCTQEL